MPAGSGATVITWSCGTDVASFTITNLDSSEFTPAQSGNNVTTFTTTDRNDTAGTYAYKLVDRGRIAEVIDDAAGSREPLR